MSEQEHPHVQIFPVGYRYQLLLIAFTKYVLSLKMGQGQRLRFLELLNDMTDRFITPEMLAVVEPMSETEVNMLIAARSLDAADDKAGSASFKVLTRRDIFDHFLELNPSLLTAIKMRVELSRNAEFSRTTEVPQMSATPDARAASHAAVSGELPDRDWQWAPAGFAPVRL